MSTFDCLILEQAAKWLEDRAALSDGPLAEDAHEVEGLYHAADAIRNEIKLCEVLG